MDDTYYPLIQLMYKDICKQLIRAADQDYKNNDFMLRNHVRFMIDDFASGAQVPGFESINVATDFYKRYQTMNHIENWNRKAR